MTNYPHALRADAALYWGLHLDRLPMLQCDRAPTADTLPAYVPVRCKALDFDMLLILATLRKRGADWTAAALEHAWQHGQHGYIDSRNSAGQGLRRAVDAANQRATNNDLD